VEIISGLTKEDKVKQWNKTEPVKKGEEEEGDEKESVE
jgi:HlyD family secretion protein